MKIVNKDFLENTLNRLNGKKLADIRYCASKQLFNDADELKADLCYIPDFGLLLITTDGERFIISDFFFPPDYDLNGINIIQAGNTFEDDIRISHLNDQEWLSYADSTIISHNIFKIFYVKKRQEIHVEIPYGIELNFSNGSVLYFFCITAEAYNNTEHVYEYSLGNAIMAFFNGETTERHKILSFNRKIFTRG